MMLPLTIATSFLITLTLMPVIIRIFHSIDILDRPDKRKIHSVSTPSLGGIAIYIGISFAILISIQFTDIATQKYFLGGSILIFLLGVRDDLSSLLAYQKLVVQAFAAILVVFFGEVKIEGLNGLFGIDGFPWMWDEIFSVFVIIIMTNAFNLIDGLDGLAGSIALIISSFLGWAAFQSGNMMDAAFSLSIAGASLAFLLYNWYPSKIFMGDTGSMVFGFMLTILMIKFLAVPSPPSVISTPGAISLALFILPVYDTLRVFLIRFLAGKHPLSPDRNHIHHVLLKLGLNHAQSTVYLISYNTLVILFVVSFPTIGESWLILLMIVVTITIGASLDARVIKQEANRLSKIIPPEVQLRKKSRT